MSESGGRPTKLRLGAKVVETLGWRWAFTRLYLEAEHRSGVIARRTPSATWETYELNGSATRRDLPMHLNDAGHFIASQGDAVEAELRAHLERLKARRFDIFGTSCAMDSWHSEPVSPATYPVGQHWSETPELPDADLKLIWEPSRFGWVFDLVRLHGIDRETAAPDVFWQLFEDWCEANQPNVGVNWKCGQEASIRLMAVIFGVQAFGPASLTPEREILLAKFADVTAQRIEAHWRYARSQDNNHIVSEAVGLISVGLLFPDLQRAGQARILGERLLSEACEKLVFADGGTSQYSLNYHRVFMDNFIWVLWLYRSVGHEPPGEIAAALRRTYDFLLAITQRSDGAAGNWGNNDGARLLPLSSTRHLDVRPTLLMAAQLLEGATYEWGGPAEEAVRWFWGKPERYLQDEPEPDGPQVNLFPYAGVSVIVNGSHRALIRGGPFQLFRPPHCDFGHVELWVEGEQVVFDPGTWSYKPKPGEFDLSETQYHNGPLLAGEQQMTRLGRFLWGDWPQVELGVHSDDGVRIDIGFRAGTAEVGRRTVTALADGWRIVDDVSGVVTSRDVTSVANELSSPQPIFQAYRQP